MPYIYLSAAIVSSAMLNVMATFFSNRNKGKNVAWYYNIIYMSAALVCWSIMYGVDFSFEPKVLLYSVGYAFFYVVALTGFFGAVANGSVALTSFVKQLSFVGVAVWGLLFWNSPLTTTVSIAFGLIAVSLFLCFKASSKGEEKSRVTVKWVVCALMLFAGNAGSSIVQKYQQMEFDGKHGNMLMCFGMLAAVAICMLIILRNKESSIKELAKGSAKFAVFGGMSSMMLNLLILLMATTALSPSLIYPGIAVGGMILSVLFSVVVCKEKISVSRWIGLAVGAVALVFLNL